MDKRKIIEFLNREFGKIKHEPAKIREFYRKHNDLIDMAVMEGGLSSVFLAGLNPEIVIGAGAVGLGALMTKWSLKEKKLYGGSFWQAGMKGKERLEEVI
jgi:hypothetical protein